jgi:hypothetical protein
MTPDKILRYLDHGFFMTRQQQAEAAAYIRELHESNNVLQKGILKYLEELEEIKAEMTK